MRAVIYCRVSTEDQEREGTSLQTQLQACRNYCQDKGYDIACHFSEAYSGLSLERPKLDELRALARSGAVDVLVVYCLDRLSRDPTHGVIITQELEKHHVRLEAVIEDVDNSELGKLISYIRGFASKLEAEKIKERTARGRKEKARQGKIMAPDYETKRLALEMLNIKVWIDGTVIEITGTIPVVEEGEVVTMQSRLHGHNTNLPFSFKVAVAA